MEATYQIRRQDRTSQKYYNPTVAEFFAGIGLMRLGLENAGWRVVFANDICKDKYAMYAANFPDADEHFILGDVHALESDIVPSVTLATASFPCTDLSVAGMRMGLEGKHSSAYWGFINVLEKMEKRRPPIVLLENVAGFLTSNEGNDFHDALKALNRLGYSVDAFIIDAANFVPQSRVRLFVVGTSMDYDNNDCRLRDTSNFFESSLRPHALATFILQHPDIIWSLREVPSLPCYSVKLSDIIEDIDINAKLWWSKSRVDYLVNQTSDKHSLALKKMMQKKRWSYATAFRRVRNGKSMAELRNDGIAGCLRTPRGGSGRQILIKAGYGQVYVRLLTPTECARLMGADEFKITTSANKALFGFGDAVCVPVVTWISQFYLNPILVEINQKLSESDGVEHEF
jgi:DNA (cytosine-5)-methyltransferase 1